MAEQEGDDQGGQQPCGLAGLAVFAEPGVRVEIENGLRAVDPGHGRHDQVDVTGGVRDPWGTAEPECEE